MDRTAVYRKLARVGFLAAAEESIVTETQAGASGSQSSGLPAQAAPQLRNTGFHFPPTGPPAAAPPPGPGASGWTARGGREAGAERSAGSSRPALRPPVTSPLHGQHRPPLHDRPGAAAAGLGPRAARWRTPTGPRRAPTGRPVMGGGDSHLENGNAIVEVLNTEGASGPRWRRRVRIRPRRAGAAVSRPHAVADAFLCQ